MDQKVILEVLKRWNMWDRTPETGIPRPRYVKQIYPYLTRKEVIVLTGIRRGGKSTIMRQLMVALMGNAVNRKQLLYLNLEDYAFANTSEIALLEEVLRIYRQHTGNTKLTYFFIDEIQQIPGWERWVRTKYDLGEPIRFVISGSSAALLSKEFSTLLTGRNLSFRIMPLSFSEFCTFRRLPSLAEYLAFGGFPEVVLEFAEDKKRMLLQQYFTDIIHKDIIDRYALRNIRQLTALASSLVSAAGGKVSMNKLAKVFGISKDTIATYISYMIDAYLLYEVPYFSYSAKIKHDVTKRSKFYVIDHGLITAAADSQRNTGQRYEHAVLIKLLDHHREISYWAEQQAEVDFVAGERAINVTATDAIPPREQRGLAAFQKKYPRFSLLLITPSTRRENILPLSDFLQGNVR